MEKRNITKIKAYLLSKSKIRIDNNIDKNELKSSVGNIISETWIFLRLSENSRVRMQIDPNSEFVLIKDHSENYSIWNTKNNNYIIKNIKVERILAHAPEQLFFLLHRSCQNNCLFCPLTYRPNNSHHTWEMIQSRIQKNISFGIKSISFTTAYPLNKTDSELLEEIIYLTHKTRELYGKRFVIGASVKTPSEEQLILLKESGINEIRLNIETYNPILAKKIMPNKNINDILDSIKKAVLIFGKNKVSSNIIIGLGETNQDILEGVACLAELGAVTTLYPYDEIEGIDLDFERPSAERIYYLAKEQNKIFHKYNIKPLEAETMCCGCAASHLYPGRDLL